MCLGCTFVIVWDDLSIPFEGVMDYRTSAVKCFFLCAVVVEVCPQVWEYFAHWSLRLLLLAWWPTESSPGDVACFIELSNYLRSDMVRPVIVSGNYTFFSWSRTLTCCILHFKQNLLTLSTMGHYYGP